VIRVCLQLLAVLALGCVRDVPSNFSPGSQWTFPLVDPLDDDRLLVPVFIDGHGPYIFALDPNASETVIADQLIDIMADRSGHLLRSVQVGNLLLNRLHVRIAVTLAGARGRAIAGVIGSDVLDRGLVFGFDRDRGIAWLAKRSAFRPARRAHVIDLSDRVRVGARELTATIDLGEVESHIAGLATTQPLVFGNISRTGVPLVPAR